MIHEKIRVIREYLNLTSTQVATLIKVNVYLYRKYEKGTMEPTMDLIVLLSIAYAIPIDSLFCNEENPLWYTDEPGIRALRSLPQKERLPKMQENLCKKCSFVSQRVNYRVISDICRQMRAAMADRLKTFRESRGIDIDSAAKIICLDNIDYLSLEKGAGFPLVSQTVKMARFYDVAIRSFIE